MSLYFPDQSWRTQLLCLQSQLISRCVRLSLIIENGLVCRKDEGLKTCKNWQWGVSGALALTAGLFAFGCGSGGGVSNTKDTLLASDTTSVAGPVNIAALQEAEAVPREKYGTSLSVDALIFPSATADERAHFARGLALFSDPALTAAAGQGPYFTETTCLGCHNTQESGLVPTPASRATNDRNFLLFGDYNPATGVFNGRPETGGPVLHTMHQPGFPNQVQPPLPGLPAIRVTGMRAAPPYIGRGLMEAIPDDEIIALKDPAISGLQDAAGNLIPGFENRNSEQTAFVGGSPVVRLSKFGLRAAGATLMQFIVAGSNVEVGLTSPFALGSAVPSSKPGFSPGPGLSAQDVRDLRTMIRLIAPPARAVIIPGSSEDRGRILFGVDFDQPNGIALDRKANCVSCHVPFLLTGQSPAEIGASHLSNKKVFLWSDLLIHDMGQADADNALPNQGRANGRMWRTTPLMGIGLIGPPFFHDGRVIKENGIDSALDLSIDAHDNNGADVDSEAHNSVERYRALPTDGVNSQRDIVNFMKTL